MTGDSAFYDDIAADFDRLIPWEKRLANERPWFQAIVERHGPRNVLDAACGSGRHLVLFAQLGLEAHGADMSPAMIELAKGHVASAGLDCPLHVCAWDGLPDALNRTFDAVVCLGNSLPYVTQPDELRASLRGMWGCVAPGGFLLIQYINYAKLRATGQRFLPLLQTDDPHPALGLRFYDFEPDSVAFNILILDQQDGTWSMRHHVTPLATYPPEAIMQPLQDMGATLTLAGGLDLSPYLPETSDNVVLLAKKP